MSSFDEREKSFEKKFIRDEETFGGTMKNN